MTWKTNHYTQKEKTVRSREEIANADLQRERYERYLRSGAMPGRNPPADTTEERVAASKAKREAAQRIGNKRPR